MNRSIKGALAAGTGGVLLLGGAGTLAYWSDSEDVGTATVNSGTITLSTPDCTDDLADTADDGVFDWRLDGGDAFVSGTTKLVPGDVVTKVCDLTLTLTGEHIGSTLTIGTPSLTDGGSTLDTELTSAATFTVNGGAYAPITAPGTHKVRATITVTLPSTVTSTTSQNGTAVLDAINVVATQTHSP